MTLIRCATAGLLALAAGAAWADEPAPLAPMAEGRDTIVIEGAGPGDVVPRSAATEFVLEIGDLASDNAGYARWKGALCVAVQNLDGDRAQYVIDRVSEVALELGLDPGEPGCRPNVVVMFTDDGPAVARTLVEEAPSLLRPFGGVGGADQGLAALEEFKTSGAPVRWWQVTLPVDELGDPAVDLDQGPGGPPTIRSGGWLLTGAARDELWSTLVVVDATKLNGATWPQLADYLAMVVLAQIDPHAATAGRDTILALFDADAPPSGLTAWDEAYLHALYELDRTGRPNVQRSMMIDAIARDRRLAAARQ